MFRLILALALGRGIADGVRHWRRKPILNGDRTRILANPYGDGKHDDTREVQKALRRSGTVRLPRAALRITDTLNVSVSNLHIVGAPTAIRMDPGE